MASRVLGGAVRFSRAWVNLGRPLQGQHHGNGLAQQATVEQVDHCRGRRLELVGD
jgi:hypothetical protein